MTRETLAAARHAAGDDKTLTDVFNRTSIQGDGGCSRRGGNVAGRTGADGSIVRGRRDNDSESAAEQMEGGDRPLGGL